MYDKGGKQTRSGMCSVFAAKATATTAAATAAAAATATTTTTAGKCHQQHCRESETVFFLLHTLTESIAEVCSSSRKTSSTFPHYCTARFFRIFHFSQRIRASPRSRSFCAAFCAASASSCSTIGNLHETQLPQLQQALSRGLPARPSPGNYMASAICSTR